MEIKTNKNKNDIFLVELSGSLDLYSSNQLKDLVIKMIKNKMEGFILDFNKVASINSSGIGALIFVSSTLKKLKCPLVIIVPEGPVMNALEVTRLRNYFTIVPSLEEAVTRVASNKV